MGNKQRNTAKLGFSPDVKERAMRDLGFSIMDYNGKIAEAPTQIRHLVRELPVGIYLVNLPQRSILKRLDENASGHKFTQDIGQLLNEAFKETIYYVLQTDYLYAIKNAEGVIEFSGILADNPNVKANALAGLGRVAYGAGYYGLQIQGTEVIFVTEPYEVFEVLLLDLALYAPVSPFRSYATPITSSEFVNLSLVYTKFGFSGDAAVTLGKAQEGKLVATVVNYPAIDGIERLFVQAPALLKLALTIANADMTLDTIKNLKADAQRIIGEIGR